MNEPVLLYSGGIDSYITWFFLKKNYGNVKCFYIDYGGMYCNKEITHIRNAELPFQVKILNMDLGVMEMGVNAYIPNRNLYLLTKASEFGDHIYYGGLKDDNVGDKTPGFASSLSHTLTLSLGRRITVDSLFWQKEKAAIIEHFGRMCMASGWTFHQVVECLVYKTTSCYDKVDHYCGECPSCFRKYCALLINGIELPFYDREMKRKYLDNISKYSGLRAISILLANGEMDYRKLPFAPLNTTHGYFDPSVYETYKVNYIKRY